MDFILLFLNFTENAAWRKAVLHQSGSLSPTKQQSGLVREITAASAQTVVTRNKLMAAVLWEAWLLNIVNQSWLLLRCLFLPFTYTRTVITGFLYHFLRQILKPIWMTVVQTVQESKQHLPFQSDNEVELLRQGSLFSLLYSTCNKADVFWKHHHLGPRKFIVQTSAAIKWVIKRENRQTRTKFTSTQS